MNVCSKEKKGHPVYRVCLILISIYDSPFVRQEYITPVLIFGLIDNDDYLFFFCGLNFLVVVSS